ncbi:sulphate transporter [Beutenbergia cavernae DSM 12333]|uniref:Sulphate transporter n=1 Tax=Beutenbergia cavernae (strain ATCC BAA-8 / DSM 12333 / CCUG 43141 / JCM 11478 / NBRC 16432 / NCIMB 13614 / HKI 0122) TaxID=471853 RepID=C5BYQ4_BEUC1|nr:SulP family inorganic anion transporter [Beutenbergia cavernae]ACQ79012.1 sulphate transporter [Beutenbergia cavernae DSM 12333]
MTAAPAAPAATKTPLFFGSFQGYRRTNIRPDVIAGLTVWAVLVPEAFAYATIAGVPPVVGLYAAVPALIAYAAFGSSRHLVVGPMSATAALSAATIAPLAGGDTSTYIVMTTVLAIMTGVAGILAGLLRLGFLAAFISEPVLKGFIVGLALTIIIGQVPHLLGVDGGGEGFFSRVATILGQLGQLSPLTCAVGIGALVLVFALKKWAPVVPASLAAVVVGIVLVNALQWEDRLDIVGHIDPGLPSLGLPTDDWSMYGQLAAPALGVLLVGFAEGLGAAKTYAAKAGYDVDANRELLGLGAANAASGLASGMVVNGSLSKTAVNGSAGAKSQLSGLVVAVLCVVTLLVLTPLFESLPDAVLAAVVIAAVIELVDVKSLARLYRVWSARLAGSYGVAARADFIAAVVAMIGVLVLDTLPGLVVGIICSLVLLLYRASRAKVRRLTRVGGLWLDAARHPDSPTVPDVVVVRVESGLFFANSDHVKEEILALVTPEVRLVVLDGQTTPFTDVTAATMLAELATTLERSGVDFAVAGDIGPVRDVVREVSPDAAERLFTSVDDAVASVHSSPPDPRPS